MIATAIVGLLASVAIPTFQRLTMRAKAAERHELIIRIKKAVADLYGQKGWVAAADGELVGDPQPALDGLGIAKRMPTWKAAGWSEIFRTSEEIEGSTYYSYAFRATEGATPTLTITVVGDLDGDGHPSTKVLNYRRIEGMYQLVAEDPPAGSEDLDTF
jgi:type II secretory pathway pseudopilin PulG